MAASESRTPSSSSMINTLITIPSESIVDRILYCAMINEPFSNIRFSELHKALTVDKLHEPLCYARHGRRGLVHTLNNRRPVLSPLSWGEGHGKTYDPGCRRRCKHPR